MRIIFTIDSSSGKATCSRSCVRELERAHLLVVVAVLTVLFLLLLYL